MEDYLVRIRVLQRSYPMHDPILEQITTDHEGKGFSAKDVALLRLIRRAFTGDVPALEECLKRAGRHEIKRINARKHSYDRVVEHPNFNYKLLGEVASLLDIANPHAAPAENTRHEREREQRYQLCDWVIEAADEMGLATEETLHAIRAWQRSGCQQWRRKRGGMWDRKKSFGRVPRPPRLARP